VKNAERCREILKDLKKIVIPKNYQEFCGEKVIVMEFVDGIPIMNI